MKIIAFTISIVLIAFTLGKVLNPFDARMFNFHDDTQAARIQEMAVNIKAGIIPPRLAPNFSHNLGFPVFNFYSPAAYWITTGFHLLGLSIPMALKLSFFLTVILSFVTMFLFLSSFFGFFPSILGGVTYASSLWVAIEIFVRGNLAECWFLVLFPLSLYLLVSISRKPSVLPGVFSILVISATLTVHNVFSLLSLGIFILFALFLKNKKFCLFIIFLGILLSSYFLIPAVLELPLTYATQSAERTNYKDHFLCAWQIWNAPRWEYSGSAAGCGADGMPFVLGKIHILLGSLGALIFIITSWCKRKRPYPNTLIFAYIFIIGVVSLFLTTYQSSIIWSIFTSILALFQFPWRFLIFGVFFFAFFTAYLFHNIELHIPKLSPFLITIVVFILLFTSQKFFSKPWLMGYDEYSVSYLSPNYVTRTVAYNIAEYLPKTANYDYWRSFDPQIYPGKDTQIDVSESSPVESNNMASYRIVENALFDKEISTFIPSTIKVNVHYFPFWKITINDKIYIPNRFDKLGRPILQLTEPSIIRITYQQTIIEQFSNVLTIVTAVFMFCILLYKPLWNKLKSILK